MHEDLAKYVEGRLVTQPQPEQVALLAVIDRLPSKERDRHVQEAASRKQAVCNIRHQMMELRMASHAEKSAKNRSRRATAIPSPHLRR
jgi:hypothetical protein